MLIDTEGKGEIKIKPSSQEVLRVCFQGSHFLSYF